ncbi:hypothetical protein NST63_26635 [Heyndrickxia sp. FSL W8-0496]|uniref:hypothetical protein n=1 Tax=Heyndrickxia TaxID=2837504 RepID=UPI0030F7A7AC
MEKVDGNQLKEIKQAFKEYIEIEYGHLKDKSVILSDTFYLNRHDIGIKFWEALESEQSMKHCQDLLGSNKDVVFIF